MNLIQNEFTGYRLIGSMTPLGQIGPKHHGIVLGTSLIEVANNALAEIKSGGKGKYNLVTNNCESFANRAMYGKSNSPQVWNTILGIIAVAAAVFIIKETKKVDPSLLFATQFATAMLI